MRERRIKEEERREREKKERRRKKRERDVGIICVIIYDDLALGKRERERDEREILAG